MLSGADIEKLDEPALGAAVLETDIFAATSPELQTAPRLCLAEPRPRVAMTADVVNDAPALKRADARHRLPVMGWPA